MIPLKLHLKNFLSYGAELQTIDFTPHHLICLSGKNGHGKSALLDAITWAIWGIARKTATSVKADQGLLRLGQQQMMVILDFALGNNTYRIRREFSFSYGKAQAHLDFGVIDPVTQKLIPLTDKTIRDTQNIIEQTINLDFDTFTNSAFLKQGQSNEFSKKSAKERKDIFATILGLNQYDIIRRKALEKTKEAQAHEKTLVAFQEKIKKELEAKDSLTQTVDQVKKSLTDNASEESIIQKKRIALEKQYELLAARIQEHNQLLYQKEQIKKRYAQEVELLQSVRIAWRAAHAQQASLNNPEQLELEQKKIIDILKIDQQKLQKSLEIKELSLKYKEELQLRASALHESHTKAQMEQRITQEQLHNTLKNLLTAQADAQKAVYDLSNQQQILQQRAQEIEKKFATATKQRTEYAEYELYFEKRKSFYQKYSAYGNMLHTKIKNLQQKQALAQDNDDASCPLCEQNLSASRRRFLHQKFSAEHSLLTHQYQRITRVITALKPALINDHANLALQKKEIDILNQSIFTLEEITKQIATLNEQKTLFLKKEQESVLGITTAKEQLADLQKNIIPELSVIVAQDEVSQKINAQLLALENEHATNQYNKEAHAHHQQLLEHIERKINDLKSAHQEHHKQRDRKQQIINQCATLKKLSQELKLIACKQDSYANTPEIESKLAAEKKDIAAQVECIAKSKEALIEQKGRLMNELGKLTLLESELSQYTKEQQELLRTIDDYTIIAHATSKDGIQALLIEEAIPEVEYEANALLSKLTNNQAQISIESLRDLKKGGTKETLDIKISDASGIRPYELFSGGEAFRIDFALRIAISKLLARRAGTALQTLIIDEGFGSQDDEGLNNIMDAIHKIQDDFAKVIIVSHLDILKDQFPVHFIVQKTGLGSSVSVIEHG